MDLETEVTIGQHKYLVGRMSVFDQMNVAADYRDILLGLSMMKRERPKDMADVDYQKAIQFIMASRGGINPEVRDRVMQLCFNQVKRHAGVGWQPILSAERTLQFADIELSDFILLAYAVLEHNKLIDFFSDSPSSSGGQNQAATGPRSRTAKTG